MSLRWSNITSKEIGKAVYRLADLIYNHQAVSTSFAVGLFHGCKLTSHATYRLESRSIIVQSVENTVQALFTLRKQLLRLLCCRHGARLHRPGLVTHHQQGVRSLHRATSERW